MFYSILQAYRNGQKMGTIAKMYSVDLEVIINVISTAKHNLVTEL